MLHACIYIWDSASASVLVRGMHTAYLILSSSRRLGVYVELTANCASSCERCGVVCGWPEQGPYRLESRGIPPEHIDIFKGAPLTVALTVVCSLPKPETAIASVPYASAFITHITHTVLANGVLQSSFCAIWQIVATHVGFVLFGKISQIRVTFATIFHNSDKKLDHFCAI